MPRFGFVPVDDDPFGPPDTSGAMEYASELGGRPDAPGTVGEAFRQDLAEVPNKFMQTIGRIGTRFEDFGNALMGNRLVVQTPDGPIDVTNESMIDAGAELSGLVGGTGSLVSRPANSLGVFAGVNAKNADLNALALAKRYKEQGAPEELIWRETGWAQGPDGEWRFEIPDQTSRFDSNKLKPWSPDETSRAREFWTKKFKENPDLHVGAADAQTRKELEDLLGSATTLEKLLDHPALYAAYPDLRSMRVERVERNDLGGYYDPEQNFVAMTPSGSQAVAHTRGEEGHGVLLHEIQHAIQTREGFAHGGSPIDPSVASKGNEIKARVKARIQVLRSQIENSPIVDEDAVAEYANWVRLWKRLETADPGELGYQALAGEVEARNVERRFDWMTRTNVPPRETEDTARAIQWVRKPERWYSKGASR